MVPAATFSLRYSLTVTFPLGRTQKRQVKPRPSALPWQLPCNLQVLSGDVTGGVATQVAMMACSGPARENSRYLTCLLLEVGDAIGLEG